jgi:hypothetical protein
MLLDIILIVETYPNFSSAFRQQLSVTRTQQQSSGILQMHDIFHSGSTHPVKMRAGFYTGEG